MSRPRSPPRAAQWLLAFVAGKDWEEVLLGDLQEAFDRDQRSTYWYWSEVIRALPMTLVLSLKSLTPRQLRLELVVSILVATLIWMWEIHIAQAFAWMIASQLISFSPLSVSATCKAAYVALYSVVTLSVLHLAGIAMRRLHTSWQSSYLRMFAIALLCLSPVLFYIAEPGIHDGAPTFRYLQITIVALATLLVSRALIRRNVGS